MSVVQRLRAAAQVQRMVEDVPTATLMEDAVSTIEGMAARIRELEKREADFAAAHVVPPRVNSLRGDARGIPVFDSRSVPNYLRGGKRRR